MDPDSSNLRDTSRPKSFNEIPKYKSWLPSSFGLLASGGPAYLHEHCDKRHRQLGPIFREHLGPIELIFVADAKMTQTVLANEGAHPLPNIPEAWLYYNRLKSINRGLFFQRGEAWHELRKTFNRILLSSENIVQFGEPLLQINSDLAHQAQRGDRVRARQSKVGPVQMVIRIDLLYAVWSPVECHR